MNKHSRQPHAILDRDSRVSKVDKMVSLLAELDFSKCERILEIGCGSGVIASRLSEIAPQAKVHAVDVSDNRIERSGFTFAIVEGTQLPFPDNHFDLVISNHVIEHVGDRSEQLGHLREVERMLSPSGLGYLAVPNKWRFVEPHYRLPFLSWLPRRIADLWIRTLHRGNFYDCVPLSSRSATRLFDESRLFHRDITIGALRATLEIEHAGSPMTRLVRDYIPDWMLQLSKPVIPTLIYLLGKRKS